MIFTQSIRKLRSDYADGSITVDTLLDHVVAQADACDPAIWIYRLSREELQAYAERLSGREGLPLYGVPFAIKDNIDLEGVPTTAGCPEFCLHADQVSYSGRKANRSRSHSDRKNESRSVCHRLGRRPVTLWYSW